MQTSVDSLARVHNNSTDSTGNTNVQQTRGIHMQVDNRRPQTAQVYQSELKACTSTGAQTNIEENTKPRTEALAQGPSETLLARRKGDIKRMVWRVCRKFRGPSREHKHHNIHEVSTYRWTTEDPPNRTGLPM